jgi:hypothetical protein
MLSRVKEKWTNMDFMEKTCVASIVISGVYVLGYFIRAIKK